MTIARIALSQWSSWLCRKTCCCRKQHPLATCLGGVTRSGPAAMRGMRMASVLPPTFMNDMVFPIDGPDGESVLAKVETTIGCVMTAARPRGIFNMNEGKAGCVVVLPGPNVKEATERMRELTRGLEHAEVAWRHLPRHCASWQRTSTWERQVSVSSHGRAQQAAPREEKSTAKSSTVDDTFQASLERIAVANPLSLVARKATCGTKGQADVSMSASEEVSIGRCWT